MKLSAYQVRCLHLTKELRQTGYSAKRIVLASRKRYVVLFGLLAVANAACWWVGASDVTWLANGFVLGALVSDFSLYRGQEGNWPMSVEITDWEKVDALIAENSDASASTETQPK